ncbi:hypothetical protein ACYOEI_19725 [Singulisphaera rosea]
MSLSGSTLRCLFFAASFLALAVNGLAEPNEFDGILPEDSRLNGVAVILMCILVALPLESPETPWSRRSVRPGRLLE